jgi:hypothetical protein
MPTPIDFAISLRNRIAVLSAGILLASLSAQAQQATPIPPCPAAQVAAFDFLVGQWHGVVYNLTGQDSVAAGPTARVSTAKVLNGCALEEHWHFEENGVTEVDGVVLRAFDAATGAWSYNLATNRNEHVTYEGQLDGGVWRFVHDLAADDKTTRIRITWVPTPTGYSEQIARSSDGGQTWALTRHINFARATGAG